MAFPRRFRAQTWFVKLATGHVEVASADVLEHAFRCGLLASHTRVSSVGAPVWTTMAEAAELGNDDRTSFPSLAPVAMDEAPEPVHGTPWRAGDFGDHERFGRSLGKTSFAIFAAVAAIALLAFGASGADLPSRAAARSAPATVVASATLRANAAPTAKASAGAKERTRLTKDQKRRIHELDAVRRLNAWKTKQRANAVTSRTPLEPASTLDPFSRGAGRFDPLNGAL